METNYVYFYLGGGLLLVILLIFLFKNNVVSVITRSKWKISTQDTDKNEAKNEGKKNRIEMGDGQNKLDNKGDENIIIMGKK